MEAVEVEDEAEADVAADLALDVGPAADSSDEKTVKGVWVSDGWREDVDDRGVVLYVVSEVVILEETLPLLLLLLLLLPLLPLDVVERAGELACHGQSGRKSSQFMNEPLRGDSSCVVEKSARFSSVFIAVSAVRSLFLPEAL